MTVLAGGLSSDDGDRSVLAPTETDAQGLSKRSKIRYARSSLVSLQKLSIKQGMLRGIEPSILSELDSHLERSPEASCDSDSKSSRESLDNGLLSSENTGLLSCKNVGMLGAGSSPGASPGVAHRDISDTSLRGIADVPQPIIEENITPLLHKCKEPYRPPHLVKLAWTDNKEEAWISPEPFGKNEGRKQNWRREYMEEMRERQKETVNDELKEASSEQRRKNVKSIPLELSKNDEIIDSLSAESQLSDNTANDSNSPATSVGYATQFPAIEEKTVYGISCTERAELIPLDNNSKSTTDEKSQLNECNIPAVPLGVLQCVGLEHIFKPETKEFSCSMLWDGCDEENGKHDHHGLHHLMLLPQEGTECKDTTASPDQSIALYELHPRDSITDNKLKFASSLGRSRRSDPQICKFFFPTVNKNLASAAHTYKPNVINSEAIVFSDASDQSKGMENQAASDALKLNHIFCSNEVDFVPGELCLPDEDNLITVEDFRVMSYKDMLEKDQLKPDRTRMGAEAGRFKKPMDIKAGTADEKYTHVTSVPPVYKGNRSYHASSALINSQVFASNVFPQQMITTTYMQDMYNVQGYPWNYQMPGYGCVPLPQPTAGAYGGSNFLGAHNSAGTSYIGWQQ